MASDGQNWTAYHGDDLTIVLTGEDNTNPTAYAMSAYFNQGPLAVGGTATLTVSTPTITVAGSGPYTITIPLSRAQTGTTLASYDRWDFELRRTDSGSNKHLAAGRLTLLDGTAPPG